MDLHSVLVHKHAKKDKDNIQPSWWNKLCQLRVYYIENKQMSIIFLGDTAGSLSWLDSTILSTWVANHGVVFGSICQLMEPVVL